MSARVTAVVAALALFPVSAWSAYPGTLPPETDVMRALATAPSVQAARWQQDVAVARQRQLIAGPHEWEATATQQRRTDPARVAYSEQAYELSRAFRWFGKSSLDRGLGAQAVSVGELSFADAWHEAARALLSGWFEWLRSTGRERVLAQQVELLEQELLTVEKRVQAGDARVVDRTLIQVELERARADRSAAELHVRETELRLAQSFPDLPLHMPGGIAAPALPEGGESDWIRAILNGNHEIELAQALHAQARLLAQRTGRERIPDPRVGLRYSHNFDGNNRLIGLYVSIPLGGPARSAAYAESLAHARIAEASERATELRVRGEAERAALAARSAYARWQQLQGASQQSQQGAQALLRGYSLGEFTIAELLLGRRQALDGQLQATAAQLDVLEAAARLALDAHDIWAPPGEGKGRPPAP